MSSYLWLKEEKSIKVIPQGFNFDDIRLAEYQRNPIPTFGYAGLFYSDIRNPKNLFEFLCSLDFDFVLSSILIYPVLTAILVWNHMSGSWVLSWN